MLVSCTSKVNQLYRHIYIPPLFFFFCISFPFRLPQSIGGNNQSGFLIFLLVPLVFQCWSIILSNPMSLDIWLKEEVWKFLPIPQLNATFFLTGRYVMYFVILRCYYLIPKEIGQPFLFSHPSVFPFLRILFKAFIFRLNKLSLFFYYRSSLFIWTSVLCDGSVLQVLISPPILLHIFLFFWDPLMNRSS